MKLEKIGVTSPGDMGQGVAMRLKACGFGVYTALEGRSARTAELAKQAGLTDCGSVRKLVETLAVRVDAPGINRVALNALGMK